MFNVSLCSNNVITMTSCTTDIVKYMFELKKIIYMIVLNALLGGIIKSRCKLSCHDNFFNINNFNIKKAHVKGYRLHDRVMKSY